MKIQFFGIALIALLGGAAFWYSSDKLSGPSGPEGITWMTNYEEAVQKAKKEKKELLLNFTGSDWCGWCKRLDAEVFTQAAFIKFADENLVCVKLDFPRRTKIDAQLQKQNYELARKHMIRGYPTILILSGDENVLLRTGYQRGGPENYVEHLKPYISQS
jgi:protein disulfide-isomerase